MLLFDLWQKTAEEILAQRRGTNGYHKNINKPRNSTLNEIFIQN